MLGAGLQVLCVHVHVCVSPACARGGGEVVLVGALMWRRWEFRATDLTVLGSCCFGLTRQRMWRARKARRMLRRLVQRMYEKVYDEETGLYYYLNRHTGEASWDKPKALGDADVVKKVAADYTEDEAATKIQAFIRSARAL